MEWYVRYTRYVDHGWWYVDHGWWYEDHGWWYEDHTYHLYHRWCRPLGGDVLGARYRDAKALW